jgi:hypothetical protein
VQMSECWRVPRNMSSSLGFNFSRYKLKYKNCYQQSDLRQSVQLRWKCRACNTAAVVYCIQKTTGSFSTNSADSHALLCWHSTSHLITVKSWNKLAVFCMNTGRGPSFSFKHISWHINFATSSEDHPQEPKQLYMVFHSGQLQWWKS